MTILQAYELAKAGKTVISPHNEGWTVDDFSRLRRFESDLVFGEWKELREPVVFDSLVVHLSEGGWDTAMVYGQQMRNLIGKRVKVTVEVIE